MQYSGGLGLHSSGGLGLHSSGGLGLKLSRGLGLQYPGRLGLQRSGGLGLHFSGGFGLLGGRRKAFKLAIHMANSLNSFQSLLFLPTSRSSRYLPTR